MLNGKYFMKNVSNEISTVVKEYKMSIYFFVFYNIFSIYYLNYIYGDNYLIFIY